MFMMMPYAHEIRKPMMDMFHDFWGPADRPMPSFRVDVKENESGYELKADLPGVKQEDIDIAVNDDTLTISADFGTEEKGERQGYTWSERRTGRFSRSFGLEGIRQEDITAAYQDGVLTLSLPKAQKVEPGVRHIAIGAPVTEVVSGQTM